MDGFKKYQHVEKLASEETDGILLGKCYVFPKIDGANASCWLENEEVQAGSRNVHLDEDQTLRGFYHYVKDNDNLKKYLNANPHHRLYGEWLVKHTLKNYRDDAWREFYVFDVTSRNEEKKGETRAYLPYPEYKPLLEKYDINYIPPLAIIQQPEKEQLINLLDRTDEFLVKDGQGKGEGIVIKNYNYENKYGRQTWAKMIRSRFKEEHTKEMGAPEMQGRMTVEKKIMQDFIDEHFVEKEIQKVKDNRGGWRSEYIPELFGRAYNELVNDEMWNIVKKYNRPEIDFGKLYGLLVNEIKEIKPELF